MFAANSTRVSIEAPYRPSRQHAYNDVQLLQQQIDRLNELSDMATMDPAVCEATQPGTFERLQAVRDYVTTKVACSDKLFDIVAHGHRRALGLTV